ncbi:MAG: UDP-3-O-(3-hydroxymyristoyl)glucosamine N-acyltransferase [Bryobacter sp.]|nr:UDP-3-O-(3-hydroxymyristoyl)glucosamine N-acyltransferase [Bryobacter sp.]
MRVRELAERLGLTFEGDGEKEISAAAELERAGAQDLSFVAGPKYFAAAHASSAGCLVATPNFEAPGRTLIRAKEARMAFAQALTWLYPQAETTESIHPTAVIAEGVELGEGVRIGAGCVVGKNVKIGAGSVLHPRVTIYEGVRIGARAVLHSGCVLGADGFGFAWAGDRYVKFPQVGTVVLGDDVEIGANTTIDRAALGETWIGNGVKIDNLVHIGHNCRIGDHVVIAAQTGLSGQVTVGDRAVIGGQVGIGDKAKIEAGATLGSGCGILTSKIVRSGQVVWGTPARPLKEYLEQLACLSRLPHWQKQWQQERKRQAQDGEEKRVPAETTPATLADPKHDDDAPK